MKRRRWRHGGFRPVALAALAFVLAMAAQAACPPEVGDGTVLRKDGLLLAFRPLQITGPIPMAQPLAFEVQLCDRDGISAATLKRAEATMPEHRHGMNYRPTVTALGGGRFRVDGMMFHMAGRWELVFEAQAGQDAIRLTHDIRIR